MYFGENIKIYGFDNESHFNSYLNYLFRSDNAQKWTNVHTSENECYTMGNPDVDHLFFARVDCPNDDIFEWNKEMHQEMHIILHDMQKRHYYPILIIIHKDQPNEYCHFHMLLDYIDPNS